MKYSKQVTFPNWSLDLISANKFVKSCEKNEILDRLSS